MEIMRLRVGPLETNCYVVSSGNECLVVDPGGYPHEADAIMGAVGARRVVGIVLTHGHADHYALWAELRRRCGAPVYMSPRDVEVAKLSTLWARSLYGFPVEPPTPDRPLAEGTELLGLRVLETPGHTPGSVCLLGPGIVFTGDTLFRGTHGRTDLPGGSEEMIRKSLIRLLSYRGYRVYPGHGEETTVDDEAVWIGELL